MVFVKAAPTWNWFSSYFSSSMTVIFSHVIVRNIGDQRKSLMSLNPDICQLKEETTAGEKAF